jgi:hypothetical protein
MAEKTHVFDNPRNVKLVVRLLVACSVVLVLLDLIIHRHDSFQPGGLDQESWFGFYAFYGFTACVLLVIVAKEIMRKLLMRAEDYYDK